MAEVENSERFSELKSAFHDVRTEFKVLNNLRLQLNKAEKKCQSSVSRVKNMVEHQLDTCQNKSEKSELKTMLTSLSDMKTTFPHPPTLVLSLIIGNINLTLSNKEDKLAFKQEYEKFKMFNTILMMILSIISLIFNEYQLPSALVHCVCVWYFFTVTLRELILRGNGSKIKLWWLVHHYCSVLLAAISLIWYMINCKEITDSSYTHPPINTYTHNFSFSRPPGPCYTSFKPQFMFFIFCLSCVMIVQFVYQRGKLYRQVAMGKSHHMMITQESQLSLVSDFSFLVICLIGIYIFQFYNAYTVYQMVLIDKDCQRWQVVVIGIIFVILGVFNSLTLMSVLYAKLKEQLANKTTTIKKEM